MRFLFLQIPHENDCRVRRDSVFDTAKTARNHPYARGIRGLGRLRPLHFLRDLNLRARNEILNGRKRSFSFIGFGMESSRRLPLSLRTELAKYRHVPGNLRHLELELHSVDFEAIVVEFAAGLQSQKGLIEQRRALSKCLDVVIEVTICRLRCGLSAEDLPSLMPDWSYSAAKVVVRKRLHTPREQDGRAHLSRPGRGGPVSRADGTLP